MATCACAKPKRLLNALARDTGGGRGGGAPGGLDEGGGGDGGGKCVARDARLQVWLSPISFLDTTLCVFACACVHACVGA